MAHITLSEGVPGIVGPMIAYPETQTHLSGLAEGAAEGAIVSHIGGARVDRVLCVARQ